DTASVLPRGAVLGHESSTCDRRAGRGLTRRRNRRLPPLARGGLAAAEVSVDDAFRAAQGPHQARGAMSALPQFLERRARLLAEAQAQRHALAEGIAVCRSVLVVVDRGIVWAAWLRARPYLVVAAATAIAVLRPRLALEWSARALTLWRVGRLLYDAVKPAPGDRGSAG